MGEIIEFPGKSLGQRSLPHSWAKLQEVRKETARLSPAQLANMLNLLALGQDLGAWKASIRKQEEGDKSNIIPLQALEAAREKRRQSLENASADEALEEPQETEE